METEELIVRLMEQIVAELENQSRKLDDIVEHLATIQLSL